ncbi:hypothetical protein [Escherichia coli]
MLSIYIIYKTNCFQIIHR